jgi:myo-inositol 2-dehydrogenase / D-chiro-inositol 1-dehydrogenase
VSKKKIAVVGAGSMALSRGKAFVDTGRAEICAVASRHIETARVCAGQLGADKYFDDYKRIVEAKPDALLIEVPHKPQNEIVLWAIEEGLDVLIGGCLASTLEYGRKIVESAARQGSIVEAGFDMRYDRAWSEIRRLVCDQIYGKPIMATGMTYFNADPDSWYYNEELSGGMPLTHLTYCHLNTMRWILGKPAFVTATGNKLAQTLPHNIADESCSAVVQFENQSFATVVGSYAAPDSFPSSAPQFVCTKAAMQINDRSGPAGCGITVFEGDESEVISFKEKESSLVLQSRAFLNAMEFRKPALNPVDDALIDIEIAEAMAISSREHRTVRLSDL